MTPLKIGLVSAMALSMAAPALAQYQPDYRYQRPSQDEPAPAPNYQPTPQYQQDQQTYQEQQRDYQQRRDAYDARKDAYDARQERYESDRAGYEAARNDYFARREAWERARAAYDARYGYGAYVRLYPAPVWDVSRWGPVPIYGPAPAAGYYGRDTAYVSECRNDHSRQTAGTVLGALAGAALGANLSAPGRHGENAVLGGVVGGVIGNAVGHASDRYHCDNHGPYYSYNDTIAYREARGWRSGRYDYDWYAQRGCRLAVAPVDRYGRDERYVRVCPDADGRYRITG